MAIDLSEFPTSESALRMLSRVSPIYDDSYVGKWLFEVMGLEMDEARALVDSLRQQCFFDQCTWALPYWEQKYGIATDESLTDEERKAAIRAEMVRIGSVTPTKLEEILETMTGREVDITEDNENYRFVINIGEGESAIDYAALIKKVDSTKPSHLAYTISLDRDASMTVYIGTAVYEEKIVELTEMDETDVTDIEAVSDENDDYLMDESGNIIIDDEDE